MAHQAGARVRAVIINVAMPRRVYLRYVHGLRSPGALSCASSPFSSLPRPRFPAPLKRRKRRRVSPVVASPSGELLPDEQIQQVLNRLTFGARPGDAAKVRRMGVEKWIDAQLHPERIDDQATDRLLSQYSVLSMKTSDIVRDYNSLQAVAATGEEGRRQ